MKQKANKNLKAFLEKLSAETRQGQKKKERASHEEVTIIASNSAEGGGVAGGGRAARKDGRSKGRKSRTQWLSVHLEPQK